MRLSPRSISALADLFHECNADLGHFFYRDGYSDQFQGLADLYGSDILTLLKDLDSGLFAYKDLSRLEAAQAAHKAGQEAREAQRAIITTICQDALASFPLSARPTQLERSLELDGLRYSEGKLVVLDKAVTELAKEQDELEQLVKGSGLPRAGDILHHSASAERHYLAGRWDDCNSQSRKFLELLVATVAKKISSQRSKSIPSRQSSPQSHEYLDFLKGEALLDPYEEKLITAAYAYIGNRGAHPGRSSQTEAAKKRLFATTLARLVLDSFIQAK